MYINKLSVNGADETPLPVDEPGYSQLTLEQTIEVSSALRGEGTVRTLDLHDDHVVELVFEDQTTWLCTPDTLEDLYPGTLTAQRGVEGFMLPPALTRSTVTRGIVETVALKFLKIFSRKAAAVGMAALALDLENKQLGDVSQRGLRQVTDIFRLQSFTPQTLRGHAQPILLFIHGTNSSSAGSFQELTDTDLWKYIGKKYPTVLAYEHETLTKSPLQNAAELIDQLPEEVELHLITHSRGGLVGEILARCSDAGGQAIGFSEKEIDFMIKSGRENDVNWIRQIQNASRQKRFRVSKFIRVACPTGGTTILSNRLDHFFNISINLLGFATGTSVNPVYVAMKNLLAAVIDQKNDPDVLPGLEAMKPDSPFITMLNNQDQLDTVINRPVVAISGNCKAKPNLKALLILAERLFFFEDNDLVVNTKSMYAGSQRKNKLQYFFDEGADVDHFHYFINKKTNAAIQFALEAMGADPISGFSEYGRGGPLVLEAQQRQALLHLRGGQYSTDEPSGKKPILLLLPGIMGSTLTQNASLIWIQYWRMLAGDLTRLNIDAPGIQSLSLIETAYRDLGFFLSTYYDVVTFPFDWRLAPEEVADMLDGKIKTLLPLNQPIRLLSHSLGGVVVRDLMVFHPETWTRLNTSNGFRVLFLGSPLRGSFRILNVLLGQDDIINKLSRLDLLHTKKELLSIFTRFPGLLGLLPLTTDSGNDFANPEVWHDLLDAMGENDWPQPTGTDLERFRGYRQTVLAAFDTLDFSNAFYIAGRHRQTPCGYRIDKKQDTRKLVLLSTARGDQSVTWDSGIPASMVGADSVYHVDHSHGELSCSKDMFSGILEILDKGKTNLFSKQRPAVRGDQLVFKKPQTTDFDLSPEGVTRTLLGLEAVQPVPASQLPVKVRVMHGDLKYSSYPILAGHFKNDSILYAEKRIDDLLTGQLDERYKLGIYPGDTGTSEIILSPFHKGFRGTVIVGLGEQEKLTAFELSKTIEQAASKYLLIVNGREKTGDGFAGPIGLSSLVIGCGYGGLTVEASAQAILQGIANANTRIGAIYGEGAKLVEEVEFVERYQDRVLGCYYAVQRIGRDTGGALRIISAGDGITKCRGARTQVNIDQGRDWWGRITITKIVDENGLTQGMNFSVSTGAAREETRDLYTTGGVVESLIENISSEQAWTEEKARAVFELLIPNDFKVRLRRHGNITWVLDKYSAQFPWELLQHKGEGVKPLCVNAGMIRQLATGDSRLNIETVTTRKALVVGDPRLNGFLPQLPGALEEAGAVAKLLADRHYQTLSLLNREQDDITTALMSGGYKIIHLAGHGIYNPDPRKPSGMVIGSNNFLTTRQIAQISDTPDLVFVNCCWLGKTNFAAEEYYQSRFKLAASLGTQLIEIGVKAVVVAGWAVDDIVAKAFATSFYDEMFSGTSFGEAVRRARENAYNLNSSVNTWGAYQCYGNPFYHLVDAAGSSQSTQYVIAAQAATDLSNLESDMGMGDLSMEEALSQLEDISKEVDLFGIRTPDITEYEAGIYKELNKYQLAIEKYRRLLKTEGGYTFAAAEQFCNLRAKLLSQQQRAGMSIDELEQEFNILIKELEALILISPTDERYNILASTWKRRTTLYSDYDKTPDLEKALRTAAENYRQAWLISGKSYPYTNWISLEMLLTTAGSATGEFLPSEAEIRHTLQNLADAAIKRLKSDDYWQMIVGPNLLFTQWLVLFAFSHQTEADNLGKTLVPAYLSVWQMLGTRNEKLIELQHLELLIGALRPLSPGHPLITLLEAIYDRLLEAIG